VFNFITITTSESAERRLEYTIELKSSHNIERNPKEELRGKSADFIMYLNRLDDDNRNKIQLKEMDVHGKCSRLCARTDNATPGSRGHGPDNY
jgi:hypothetical protein